MKDFTSEVDKFITEAQYGEGQMQREQLKKMSDQLLEAVEYMEGVTFEDWTKDMISKSEIYIQNIYDFIEAKSPKEQSEGKYKYKDPKTNEVYEYDQKSVYRKDGRVLIPVVGEKDD